MNIRQKYKYKCRTYTATKLAKHWRMMRGIGRVLASSSLSAGYTQLARINLARIIAVPSSDALSKGLAMSTATIAARKSADAILSDWYSRADKQWRVAQ